jgi:hypothetical protein
MAGMTRIDRIRKSITLHNLESMIQSGMPGYRITIYTKEYRQLFCGNSAEAIAYLEGYGNGVRATDTRNPYYNPEHLPEWYTK